MLNPLFIFVLFIYFSKDYIYKKESKKKIIKKFYFENQSIQLTNVCALIIIDATLIEINDTTNILFSFFYFYFTTMKGNRKEL